MLLDGRVRACAHTRTYKSQLESSNCAVHYADWCTAFPHKRAFLQTFEGRSVSHKGLKSRQAWMHVSCQIWSIIERQISFRCFSYLLLVGKCHGANILNEVYSLSLFYIQVQLNIIVPNIFYATYISCYLFCFSFNLSLFEKRNIGSSDLSSSFYVFFFLPGWIFLCTQYAVTYCIWLLALIICCTSMRTEVCYWGTSEASQKENQSRSSWQFFKWRICVCICRRCVGNIHFSLEIKEFSSQHSSLVRVAVW